MNLNPLENGSVFLQNIVAPVTVKDLEVPHRKKI